MLPRDSIQEYEAARLERLYDGLQLSESDRPYGAVYLIGYSVELTLKVAFFRLRGYAPNYVISNADMRTAEAEAMRLRVSYGSESFHSVLFWADLVIRFRRSIGRPLRGSVESQLLKRARRLHVNWKVEMRYKRDRGSEQDYSSALNAAIWFEENAARLWR